MNLQSLHTHTVQSDGLLTHQQVLDIALKAGVGIVAFTDHDSVPSENVIKKLQDLHHQTKWLIGIEMSAGLPKELGGGAKGGPHVIGLFVDPTNPELLEHCKKTQEQRIRRMQKIVSNFQSLGFDLTEQDVLKVTTGQSLGRPHIVTALKSKSQNIKLLLQYVEKMRIAGESNEKIKQQYTQMMQLGEAQYPYVLFLSDDAFIPQVYVFEDYWLDFDQSVSLIRKAGGLAFIAHYTTSRDYLPFEVVEKLLAEDRVDGMETVYGLWEIGSDKQKVGEEDKAFIRELLHKYDKLLSGGADAHKEEDFFQYAQEIDYSKESEGLLETIMEKKKVNKTWSNL